jgi:hypothetical protein
MMTTDFIEVLFFSFGREKGGGPQLLMITVFFICFQQHQRKNCNSDFTASGVQCRVCARYVLALSVAETAKPHKLKSKKENRKMQKNSYTYIRLVLQLLLLCSCVARSGR